MWKCGLGPAIAAIALSATPVARPADYRAIVEQFATAPNQAIEAMLAMPGEELTRGVREAAADASWPADALDRAMLMHVDAIVVLARDHNPQADIQMDHAAMLAAAAALRPGNEWFVHRWYRGVLTRVTDKAMETQWHTQRWYATAKAIDRARELELDGQNTPARVDIQTYDPPAFKLAVPLFEQGIAGGFPVAALHLGRIQMLRGNNAEAERLLKIAANDPSSRVNRYLGNLLLGTLDERWYPPAADRDYRSAVAALPRAQSGRLALSALLMRTGRDGEARTVLDVGSEAPFHDPWWSYFRVLPRDTADLFAELHVEVSP